MNNPIYFDVSTKSFYKCFRIFFKKKIKVIPAKFIYDINYCNQELIPNIKNLSLIGFLYGKYKYHLKENTSDFGKSVKFKIDNFYFDKVDSVQLEKLKGINNDNYFWGILNFSGTMFDLDNNELFKIKQLKSILKVPKMVTKDFLEDLFSLSFSGIYNSARNEEKVMKFFDENIGNSYYCSVCDKHFSSLDELYSHILESKHKDTILNMFPYDEELKRIKNIIDK